MSESDATTREIRVQVRSFYVPERSDPVGNQWLFAYTIRITNQSEQPVRLLNRHWIITDANGEVEEVRGAGVVGQQPVLLPGVPFEYTSFCPLKTRFGTMHGSYEMDPEEGPTFDVEVAPFALSEPNAIN